METEHLINSVYNRKPIWDQSHPDHRNRYALDKLWVEVAEECRSTVKQVQTKWKNLKDYFRRELKKIPVPRSGDSGDVIEKSHWPYFKNLLFLKNQVLPRQSESNLPNDQDSNDSDTDINRPRPELLSVEETNRETIQIDTEEDQYSSHPPTPSSSAAEEPRTILKSRIRKRQNHVDALVDIEKQKLDYLRKKQKENKPENKPPDEHELFFDSLLPHVRKIKQSEVLQFRNEIQKLVQKYAYGPPQSQVLQGFNYNSPMFSGGMD